MQQSIVSSNESGHLSITVRSVPGIASLSLYTVNGRMVFALPGTYSSKGIYTFTVRKNTLAHIQQTSNLYIVKVSLNGADAGAFRFTF